VKAITERKAAYLAEQKRIAARFIALGGPAQNLGEERIDEAIRVTSLPDSDFEDYVQGWIPIKITP